MKRKIFGIFIALMSLTFMGCPTPVTPAPTSPALGTDATLSALSLTGVTISPSFAAGTVSYTASVANGVSTVTVNATKTDAEATITSGTGSKSLPVVGGSGNALNVVVTAADGTTTKTYTILVTRAAAADTTPPANITSPLATAGDTQVTLSWAEPADADYASVEITGDHGVATVVVNKGTTSKVITGLTNSTLYTFTIKSTDSTGNKASGVTATATPSATAPTTYVVTFNVNGGTTVDSLPAVTSGSTISTPSAPTKTGYTFVNWYKADMTTLWNFGSDTITAATTIYAKWTINSYTVSYNVDGGSAITATSANYNTLTSAPTPPTKSGYTFDNWYKADLVTVWNFASDTITANTTLYAKWNIVATTYVVTFNVDGGTTVSSLPAVTSGSTISTPTAPTKIGYTFVNWYKADMTTLWNFGSDTITAATTIYAKWTINSYTVSYNVDGGSAITATSANYNTLTSAPTPPTKSGYTFDNWYKADLVTVWK